MSSHASPPQGEGSVRSSNSVAAGGLWESPGTCDQRPEAHSGNSMPVMSQLTLAAGGGGEGPERAMPRTLSESMPSIASSSSLSPSPLSPSSRSEANTHGHGQSHPGNQLSALKLPPEGGTGSSSQDLQQQGNQEEASYVVGEFHEKNCPICLERYTESNPAIFYSCNHTFHLQCAESWYQRNRSCPVCLRHTDTSSGRLMTPRDIQKTRSSREKRRTAGGGGNSRKSSSALGSKGISSTSSAVSSASWLQRQGGRSGSGVELAHDLTDSDSDHAVRRPLIHTSSGPSQGSGTSDSGPVPPSVGTTAVNSAPTKAPAAIPGEDSEGERREEDARSELSNAEPSHAEAETITDGGQQQPPPAAAPAPPGAAASLIRNPKAAMLRGLRVFARLCC